MKTENKDLIHTPLRPGLLSTAIVAWGVLRELWWVGILVALLIESPRFIAVRKDFKPGDFLRAFNLSYILVGIVAFILWLQDAERSDFEVIIETIPLYFIPVLLTQRFSLDSSYPVHASSIITYWRAKTDDGRSFRMNFEYIFMVFIIIGASWNLGRIWMKAGFALLVIMVLWRVLFNDQRKGGLKYTVYVISIIGSIAMMFGLMSLYSYLESGKWYNYLNETDTADEVTTNLGAIGKIKQSPRINWRIISANVPPPKYLRDRVFNKYDKKKWYHDPVNKNIEITTLEDDYTELVVKDYQGKPAFYVEREMTEESVSEMLYSKLRIRGKAGAKTLMPVTNSALVLNSVSVDAIEYNSLGSYVAINPGAGVLDYLCYSRPDREKDLTEFPPDLEKDLAIPDVLEESLETFLSPIEITDPTDLSEVSRRIAQVFQRDYQYTLDARITGIYPIKRFLLTDKRGHCEYYATAGVLLLRSLGIPARYTVGYSVREYDDKRDEWVLRGAHAHAWVRAWDKNEERWIDVEFTPQVNDSFGVPSGGKFAGITDTLLRWKQDIAIWRAENADSWILRILPWLLVVILIIVVGRNLVKVANKGSHPLDQLLSPLRRKPVGLAQRNPSEPLETWLTKIPIDNPDKQALINKVEHILYSGAYGLGKTQQAELKQLVKNVLVSANTMVEKD